jgi:hypothetical protein
MVVIYDRKTFIVQATIFGANNIKQYNTQHNKNMQQSALTTLSTMTLRITGQNAGYCYAEYCVCITILSVVIVLNVILYDECYHTECYHAECYHAECYHAECD